MVYRLRLAAKKVEDDRKYQEELRHLDEIRLKELLKPLITKEQPKTVEEVLEEEIVKNTNVIISQKSEKGECEEKESEELAWW